MTTATTTSRRRRFITFTAALLVLGVVSVAAAAWLADGEGTGTIGATEAQELTLTFGEDGIYPNDDFNVDVTVDNANPYNVTVLTLNLGADGITSDSSGCTDAGIDWNNQTFTADTHVVGAADSLVIAIEDAVTTNNDLENECQGAEFTIPLVLTGASTAAAPTS